MGVFSGDMTSKGRPAPYSKNAAYYFKKIGVSVLFSGAAVGVSHVVQATRAGADFSLALIPVILACLTMKYPSFLFGPLYTKVTGESVVRGYARLGLWTLPIVGLSFLCVMFTVVAAVAMLASGIFAETLGIKPNITMVAASLCVFSTVVTLYLPFDRFQSAMKIVFVLLVVMSVLALALAAPSVSYESLSFSLTWSSITREQIFFIAALIGWMPAGLDLPMMHSQWLLAKGQERGASDNIIEDFNFGYISTTFLAILFVFIGAIFFYGNSISMSPSAGGFSKQLLSAYSNVFGEVGGLVIGSTLFLAIFSSLLVVVDGFPRVLSEVLSRGLGNKSVAFSDHAVSFRHLSSWVQLSGAILILVAFSGSLKSLVDFATIVSFLLGPLFAILNHKIVTLSNFSSQGDVSPIYLKWSGLGICFFTLFTGYYIFLKLLT